MTSSRLLGFLWILQIIQGSHEQVACPDDPFLGNDNINRTKKDTDLTDFQFLIVDAEATCYGAVESWNFWNNGPLGLCHDMIFQVWRPLGGDSYELVGSNPYVCLSLAEGSETFPLPTIEQIPIQPDDIYGWVDVDAVGNTSRLMTYDEAGSASGQFHITKIKQEPGCGPNAGDQCIWSESSSVRGYSLNAVLVARPLPYFTNLPQTVSVYENTLSGMLVYKVAGYNDFNYNDVVNPELVYSITGGTCTTKFDIDQATGQITTSSDPLDFEATATGYCSLDITVAEGPNTATDTLTVNVNDMNEPHIIDNLPDTVTALSDNTPNNDRVFTVTIIDIDTAGTWPAKVYSIVSSDPPNPPFTISSTTGEVTSTQNLDFWTGPDRYALQIMVTDGQYGDGPEELVIEITNIRKPPHIKNLDGRGLKLLESETAVTTVFTVEAETDPIGDTRGTMEYRITQIYPLTTPTNLFTINTNNGNVRNKANPGFDYFVNNQYIIEIEAVWIGGGSGIDLVSPPGNLTVDIEFVNQPPYHKPSAEVFSSRIMERQAIGSALPNVKLNADDRDIPHGDYIHYTVNTPWFWADNVTNEVYVQQLITLGPGHSYKELFTFEILVLDAYGEVDNATLNVEVTDINDHSPVFSGDPYFGSIVEDDPGGTTTGINLTVTDDDAGVNAELRFTILEPIPASFFQVEEKPPSSGIFIISNKQPIPYDIYKNMTFTVMAIDNGDVERNATASVFVEILEGNVNTPYFDPDFAVLDLRSDTPIGDVIYTAVAKDLDSPNVQVISYYWLIIDDYYHLEEQTGEVKIDRDLVAFRKHLLYLAAKDQNIHGNDKHHSEPFTLRIDTYKPETTLVDIFLDIPLATFAPEQTLFLDTLNKSLPQWDVKIESVRLEGDQTVVRVYAVESALPDLPQNQAMDKIFVDEDALVKVLRKRLRGTPKDFLKGPDFAKWQPVKVTPAYPIWIVDTPGGVALLTILCALFVAGVITMFVMLARKYGWCCYKNRKLPKIKKTKVKPSGESKDQFKLNYLADGDTPYHIANKPTGGYTGPLMPMSTFNTAPNIPPKNLPPKPSYDGSKMIRTSINEPDPDYNLPPVQKPLERTLRPPPRQLGGEAA